MKAHLIESNSVQVDNLLVHIAAGHKCPPALSYFLVH